MFEVENLLFTAAAVTYFISMAVYFVYIAAKNDKLARAGLVIQLLGLLMHSAAIVVRGAGAGRLPLTNQYEFATSFAWGLCLVSVFFILRFKFRLLGAFSVPVVFLLMGYAAMQSKDVRDLMPALQSGWLGFHVSTAIIAYGAFGVSFVLGIVYLMRDRIGEDSFLARGIPKKEKLDVIGYRSNALGMLFLTICIITGAIWAERAWGSYWSWDPKETWSLITWLVYAVYLHLRLRRNWQGRAAAVFSIVGFICVLFTYVGVNTLMPGLHSYK